MMPVVPSIKTTRISQHEFKDLSYGVMQHVFEIHNEFGRLFDEKIYKRELAARMHDVELEVLVELIHGSFVKRLFADVIVSGSGLFEFKVADTIHPKHRSQAMQYLLLFDLSHAKIVNTQPDQVQHEFVNCHQRLADLRRFKIDSNQFDFSATGAHEFYAHLVLLLRDWGTGLCLSLYEQALHHCLHGEESGNQLVSVNGCQGHLGEQPMGLAAPGIAFKLTALSKGEESFQTHAKRLLNHTSLNAIHWANIKNELVTFKTIR